METVENELEHRFKKIFDPIHLEIHNESHQHSGLGRETHFRVLMASTAFEGKTRLERQQMVENTIKDLLSNPIHAFSQRLLTPKEFDEHPDMPDSPNCRGGSKI